MGKEKIEEVEIVEGEVILSTLEGGEPGSQRKLRVYDPIKGDFIITIPSECKVTFGYFNPASAEPKAHWQTNGPGGGTMKTTCLRIYESNKSNASQLAAFLGVNGFRDVSITLTRLTQKVTIETNYEDDGEGMVTHSGKKLALPVAVEEDTVF